MRRPTPEPPAQLGRAHGLAYALFAPRDDPLGGVLIHHGAGSCKESHFDFARACRAAGLAALCFDARGHGESDGPCGAGMVADVEGMAALLPPGPLALRGSSMGGYVALLAAVALHAAAVVAICPASEELLRRGLREGRFEFDADVAALDAFLAEHPLADAVAALRAPLLILHARGDERVPVEDSRALLRAAGSPEKRLIDPPGGDHRSLQHDPELQAVSIRFLRRALAAARGQAG